MLSNTDNQQQVFSQQQDAQCIQLKQKIFIKPNEMHVLINDRQKFLSSISHILNRAKHKIDINQKQQLKFALIYLKQAERVVQYAASCGKNINKQLIIHILHNQASIYQKLWQLVNCSNYLEGIIYNYQQFIRQTSNHHSQLIKDGSQLMSPIDPSKFKMKQKLSRYNLQFCAINSQIANHDTALLSIKKALNLINDSIKGTIEQFKKQINCQYDEDNKKTVLRLGLLLGLSHYQKKFEDKFDFNQINKFILKSTHFSLQIWQSQKKLPNLKYKDNKQYIQYLNNYSIGNIVEITALKFDETEIGIFSVMKDKINIISIDKEYHVHNKIILLSACMFSKATELRLKSFEIYKAHPQQRKTSREYKLSINYHLLSIMIIAISIPYNLKYMNEIMLSFQKHYNMNLAQYKTVQEQSISKIIEILHIQVSQYDKLLEPQKFKQIKTIQTKQSQIDQPKNDYNLKSNFQIDKIKKTQKLKRLKKITNDLTSSDKNMVDSKLKTLNNKSKEYKTSLSINNKTDRKERHVSRNQSLKKSPNLYDKHQEFKERHFYNYSKDKLHNNLKISAEQKKNKNDIRKSQNRDKKKSTSKSKSKHIVDETQELFFCFTKKTKKTQGLGSPHGHVRGSSSRSSSVKSKEQTKKAGLNTPRNMKVQTMKSPKNTKQPTKRKNFGQSYYNF